LLFERNDSIAGIFPKLTSHFEGLPRGMTKNNKLIKMKIFSQIIDSPLLISPLGEKLTSNFE
jgi:hypothetical protein